MKYALEFQHLEFYSSIKNICNSQSPGGLIMFQMNVYAGHSWLVLMLDHYTSIVHLSLHES